MRLLKITTLYKSYWQRFYAERYQLAGKSYAEQKQVLDYDGFGWADFWSHALTPLGYEVMEVSANVEPLQRSWALENTVKFNSTKWLFEIAFEQVKKFQPEILFVEDFAAFTPRWIHEVRQACPSIYLVIGWCGAPYTNVEIFKSYDLVLSCIPELVKQFRSMGCKSEHVNHAFDRRICNRIDTQTKPSIDFSFIGQIVRTNQYHLHREQLLEHLVAEVAMQLYSPSYALNSTWLSKLKVLTKANLYTIFQFLRAIGIPQIMLSKLPKIGKLATMTSQTISPVSQKLRPFMKPPVFGLEMFQTLRSSRVTFNSHIDISPHSASNMRVFEATGVGACLLTDWKENIGELFEPDREVVTYKTAEECVEKVKWLLDHPQEREAIAQAGQARTLKDHTFSQRTVYLDEIIKKNIK